LKNVENVLRCLVSTYAWMICVKSWSASRVAR